MLTQYSTKIGERAENVKMVIFCFLLLQYMLTIQLQTRLRQPFRERLEEQCSLNFRTANRQLQC
jgi:hypothetical protein